MKNILFLLIFIIGCNVSCKKNETANNLIKPSEDTIESQYETSYFDDDNIKDKIEILSANKDELSSFILSIGLSSLKETAEIPILNNSILYNNVEADYYLSDPIIKNKVVELRIDYADQVTQPNISGEKKDLIEKIKFRFDAKTKKIQLIGYDLNYTKNKKKYSKSFNFITGSFNSSYNFNGIKNKVSGSSAELKNIFTDDWNLDFLNKLKSYGNEIE